MEQLPRIILASASPRRHELLRRMGVPFTILALDTDETVSGLPQERVRVLAERKAQAVADTLSEGLVIGADTLVALGEESLGKPADDEDARRMLRALSGKTHQVHTGVCLLDAATGRRDVRVASSDITMRDLTDGEIDAYIRTGEPHGKAGAYAIQGLGGKLISGWEGSYDNIVGLPTEMLREMLDEFARA